MGNIDWLRETQGRWDGGDIESVADDEAKDLADYAIGIGVVGPSMLILVQAHGAAILATRDGGVPLVWDEVRQGQDTVRVEGNQIVVEVDLKIATPHLCVVIYPDGRIIRGRDTMHHIQMENDISIIYAQALAQQYAAHLEKMINPFPGRNPGGVR